MRRGTPGFIGRRLREAREVRGLTATALSELLDGRISPQSISLYEHGKSSPSPEVFGLIAAALNMPEPFFLRGESVSSSSTVFYRSMSAATKAARARAEGRHKWLREIAAYLTEFVEFPKSNFPALDLPRDPLLISNDEIEEAAADLRKYWGLRESPISNMILLLENHGAILARDRLGAETLDGLSEFVADTSRPYIIIGTDKGTPVRWRFDAAHELGHMVLHSHVAPELLARKEHFKRIEEQAHRFAAAFLLPLAPFGDDFFAVNLDTLVALKPKWKVSIAMMIGRAAKAGFMSEDTARRLWINYSRRGWKRNEPYDDSMEPEEPRLLRRSFELVLGEGGQTAEDVLVRLALPMADVEALCNLPGGYLRNYSPVSLREGVRTPEAQRTPADVIQLPLRPRSS